MSVDPKRDSQPSAGAIPFPSLADLLNSPDELDRVDIAAANLLCASDLPGAGLLNIDDYLQWLDDAADRVRRETERNYYKFLDAPAPFAFSQARFCMVCLVTVLQEQCGVQYNPKWKGLTPEKAIPAAFGSDASDVFIHAIVDGIGGTCGSLPVLYVAVGRRLGYPLNIVKAARHLFVRWDDPNGKLWFHPEQFNVEATGPGIHFLPDEHYRTWPHPIPDDDIQSGVYLRSLSRREELAEFVATRGHCLQRAGRLPEAITALGAASRLSPHNRHFAESHSILQVHQAMRRRGHAYLNAPVLGMDQQSTGPFWMAGRGGRQMLVQIASPVRQPFTMQPAIGLNLVRRDLRTPNGINAEVWLPVHEHVGSMTAHWVDLHNGSYALVHVATPSSPPLEPQHIGPRRDDHIGQPIEPPPTHPVRSISSPSNQSFPWQSDARSESHPLSFGEQNLIAGQIQQHVRRMRDQSRDAALPPMPALAIPPGPVTPRLPQSGTGNLIT